MTIPGTSYETPLRQDECQNLQKLLKEHRQTGHLHCVGISVDHGNINLLKYPTMEADIYFTLLIMLDIIE